KMRRYRIWSVKRRLAPKPYLMTHPQRKVLPRWHLVSTKKELLMLSNETYHDYCYQGSTDFYNTPATDPYTPSYLEAKPLADSVATRWEDGRLPPWIIEGKPQSPVEQYVEWFNGIWHTGDPSSWNRAVFTNTAVTIDPSGITRGAGGAAANFRLLFQYFPELRGEV